MHVPIFGHSVGIGELGVLLILLRKKSFTFTWNKMVFVGILSAFNKGMTGGGFGGCAIVLAEADKADAIADAIAGGFAARFGRRCPIFATRAAQGASVVE